MSVLIAFATVEGQTGRIARFAAQAARAAGHEAILAELTEAAPPPSLDGVARVILAAPVHERRHPRPFEDFLAAHRAALAARRTLLLSVSLSAAFPEKMEEAQDYLTEMKMRTEFEPDAEMLVAGAVRSRSYDYFQNIIVKNVVLRGRAYDPAAGEHEFTDWDALGAAIAEFLRA